MRCPSCGYVSFDYLDACKKCGSDLRPYKEARGIWATKPLEPGPAAPPAEETHLLTPSMEAQGMPPSMKEVELPEYDALSFLESPVADEQPPTLPTEDHIPQEVRWKGLFPAPKEGEKAMAPAEVMEVEGEGPPPWELALDQEEIKLGIAPETIAPPLAPPPPSPQIVEEEELEAIDFTLPPSLVEKPSAQPAMDEAWSALREAGEEAASLPKAGFWIRFLAFLIDYALLSFAGTVLAYSIFAVVGLGSLFSGGFTEDMMYLALGVVLPVLVAIIIAYYVIFVGWRGQTPGKILLKLKIIQDTGEEMTYGRAFLRWVGYLISTAILGIGYIMIAFSRQKQGLHDKIASTYVVRI
ncbi:MAG: RDD family protein [candidate division NC10 bacterium]|nr:RDD family protein [candidate division NC10 bacterium]